MFGLMLGMGMTLSVEDFRRIALAPAATVLGTLLQLVGMPLAGLALALAYGLPPLLAAGLVIVAACPGGLFSNMYVHLAGGNTALSITLTASATMVTLFTLPVWVHLVLAAVGGGGASVDLPILGTALRLASFTVLPVACGMVLRHRVPELLRFEKWLARVSAGLIVVGVTVDALGQPDPPIAQFRQSLPPALWLLATAAVSGLLVPRLLRLGMRDAVTITVELLVKNGLLGLVLARQSLSFDATIPILAFITLQTPIAIAVLVAWRLLERRAKATRVTSGDVG
jgi:BASS family bile acid:Na+ symporter